MDLQSLHNFAAHDHNFPGHEQLGRLLLNTKKLDNLLPRPQSIPQLMRSIQLCEQQRDVLFVLLFILELGLMGINVFVGFNHHADIEIDVSRVLLLDVSATWLVALGRALRKALHQNVSCFQRLFLGYLKACRRWAVEEELDAWQRSCSKWHNEVITSFQRYQLCQAVFEIGPPSDLEPHPFFCLTLLYYQNSAHSAIHPLASQHKASEPLQRHLVNLRSAVYLSRQSKCLSMAAEAYTQRILLVNLRDFKFQQPLGLSKATGQAILNSNNLDVAFTVGDIHLAVAAVQVLLNPIGFGLHLNRQRFCQPANFDVVAVVLLIFQQHLLLFLLELGFCEGVLIGLLFMDVCRFFEFVQDVS